MDLISLSFGILSFITTLGMLFMLRSLCVVIYQSGGGPGACRTRARSGLNARDRICPRLDDLASQSSDRDSFSLNAINFWQLVRATGGASIWQSRWAFLRISSKRLVSSSRSVCAGLAGIIQVVRIASPLPSLGDGVELQAIAAAVIGGVALSGGVGNVLGAVVGMAIIRVIDSGMVMSRVDANWFKFAVGFLTIVAVIANIWLGRRARGMKVDTGK